VENNGALALPIGADMTEWIAACDTWIVRFQLERPIHLGRWIIRHRDYAVLEMRTDSGRTAAAYAFTRDADLASGLGAAAAHAVGRRPEDLLPFPGPAVPSGLGSAGRDVSAPVRTDSPVASHRPVPEDRAAALLDACAWDLSAQAQGLPLWALLADGDPPANPPAAVSVAVCGYPIADDIDAAAVAAEVESARADGYGTVKVPGLGSAQEVDERLAAIRAADDSVEIIVDLVASQTRIAPVLERAHLWRRHRLLWLEDPFLPEHAGLVPALVRASPTAIAIGDDWGEQAVRSLLAGVGPRPLLRLDFAALGEISVARQLAHDAGARVAQHIYPELQRHLVHAGLAVPQLDIYREQPTVDFAHRMLGRTAARGGRMEAPQEPGPCMQLDHDLVTAHAIWHLHRESGNRSNKVVHN
jgi:L-alanine-DL-glutamate epimerase-like enolase superfamily enzyme